jgi:regulator of sigma D
MKEHLTLDQIKKILEKIDGECVPLVFIDHIDIFYNNGSVKTVDGARIKRLFPEIRNTTMGILKHNNDISEINVKVDMAKIHGYLNALCNQLDILKNKEVKRILEGNE